MTDKQQAQSVPARLALDAIATWVALLDANGLLREANRSLRLALDLPPAQLAGMPFWSLPCWSAPGEARDLLARAMRGETVLGELQARMRGRPPAVIGLSLVPLSEGEDIAWIVAEAREVRAAPVADETLLARLGRELRNPLASLRHAAQLARTPGIPEDRLRWAQDMLDRQVEQLARTLDAWLDVARDEPLAVCESPAPADPPKRGALDIPLRVLVADDNRDNADACAALLGMLGHDVRTAYSGFEAIAVADVFRPQVALLDIGMPGANGFEVARRIRSRSWGAAATLIAVTGWAQEEDRRQAEAAGFDHHLVKPVDLQRLEPLLQIAR